MASRNSLIGYALSFCSFLLDSNCGDRINKIILFGSVARGDFTEESDIDLFVDAEEKYESEIKKVLILFRASQVEKNWRLKGLKNELSLKIGKLENWSLHREVVSSGILCYGKYQELPKNLGYYILIQLDISKLKATAQVSVWRKLYGYSQKVGKKSYVSAGLVESLGGKKLGKAIFIVPMEHKTKIIGFLKQKKVNYQINEVWSDTF